MTYVVGSTAQRIDCEITYHYPIVFLPGIMGTRLHIQASSSDEELNRGGAAGRESPSSRTAGLPDSTASSDDAPNDEILMWEPDELKIMRDLIKQRLSKRARAMRVQSPADFPQDLQYADALTEIARLYPTNEHQRLAMKAGRGERLSLDEQNKMTFFRLDQLDVATDAHGFATNADVFEAERERLIERGWNEPVWQYYGPMLLALEQAQRSHGDGRIRGGDCPVYACGYDWRQSNAISARRLHKRLQEIHEREERITGSVPDGFILVTHSMGGLVARSYLEQFAEEADEQIAAVVHISQPAHGAPILYRRLKTGVSPARGDDSMTAVLDDIRDFAIYGESPRRTALMISGFPSVLELLPTTAFRLLDRQRETLPEGLHSWLSWERGLLPTDPPDPQHLVAPGESDAPPDATVAVPPERAHDYMYATPNPDRADSPQEADPSQPAGTPLTGTDPYLADLFGDAYGDPTGLVGVVPSDLGPPYADRMRRHLENAATFQKSIADIFHPVTYWAGSTGHRTDTALAYRDPTFLELEGAMMADMQSLDMMIWQRLRDPKIDVMEGDDRSGEEITAVMLHYQPEEGDGTVPLASQLGPEGEDSTNVHIVEGPGHAETCASETLQEQTLDWIQSVIFAHCPPRPEEAAEDDTVESQ